MTGTPRSTAAPESRASGSGARRILFASTVSELAGGAERSLLELARALPPLGWQPALAAWQPGSLADAFRRHGFDVHIYRESGRQPGSPLGGATLRLPALAPAVRVAVWSAIAARPIRGEVAWLRSVIERGRYAVLHSNCDLSIPAARRAALRAGVPYVAHVRDHWRHWLHPRIAGGLRGAHAVLVASDHMAAWLRGAGLAPRVVHNPVDGGRLSRVLGPGERDALRRRLGLDEEFAVAVIGRIDSRKRQDVAIRAAAAAPRSSAGLALVIAGRGPAPQEERLRRLAAAHGAQHAVRWLGQRSDVAEWLPAMDALLMPSEGEPFGRVIVEAMLAGLPVVAAGDGAAVELIRDGVTGLLVAPGDVQGFADALGRLMAEPDLRARLGTAARREALRRFDPAVSAAQVAELYAELTRGARNEPSRGGDP